MWLIILRRIISPKANIPCTNVPSAWLLLRSPRAVKNLPAIILDIAFTLRNVSTNRIK